MGLEDLPDLGKVEPFEILPCEKYNDYAEIAEIELRESFIKRSLCYVYGKCKNYDGEEGILVRHQIMETDNERSSGFFSLKDIIGYRTLK